MKQIWWIVCLCLVLSGCGKEENEMDRVLGFRESILHTGCSFDAKITADYGDVLYCFRLGCEYRKDGTLRFSVLEPETIAHINGEISPEGGKLTFDDHALGFALLADGQISPVSGPYLMMKAITAGYIASVGMDGEYLRVTVHDSYAEDAFRLDVWLGPENKPVQADVFWKNRKILTIAVENFVME